MKNATKHAEELKSMLRKSLKEARPEPRQPMEPLKALVRGAMSFDVPDARAEEAMRMIDKEFVDLNELRVATDLEIQEMLGVRYPAIEQRVAMITQSLNSIFEKEHTLSLDRLKTISKRDARQFLRGMPDMHPFVEAFVMLFAFDGPAMPMDDVMAAALRDNSILDEDTSTEDAQKFIEHHLKMDELYDLYRALRRTAYAEAPSDDRVKKKTKASQ